ncbi:hypothetical protein [Vibrio renipiscarius]|uniref:Uncharacterized protein n=1 Tax=Vibrio renipiscarius TaxID=1461322 RepID=A0A0C2JUL1_9VIBR|nr:hypothetical protein [Vibrio renipiscarius]KII81187.1 hypothetical protein OJ16_02755 [Vibrio renipiscarius]KII81604.1 hypothetical protein PL18_03280 [Vibrio renipiscarius]
MDAILAMVKLTACIVRSMSNRFKLVFSLILIYMLALPVFELAIFNIIASILSGGETEKLSSYYLLFLMAAIYAFNAILKYYTKVGKVKCINRIVSLADSNSDSLLKGNINWLRMTFLELFNAINSLGHIVIISILSFMINNAFGAVLLLGVFLIFYIFNLELKKQIHIQKKIRYNASLLSYQKGENNVLARTKASEKITFIINSLVAVLIAALFFCHIEGYVDAKNGLILLFVIRFISSNLSNLGACLMRFSRGWVNVFDKYNLVLEKQL